MNNSKPVLIENGRIIDPGQNRDEIGSLMVKDGTVIWTGKSCMEPKFSDYTVINAWGMIVCPGFL